MEAQLGLHFADPGGLEEFHVVQPVGLGIGLEPGQLHGAGLVQRHHELAAAPVADAVLGAELIEKFLAAKHQAGLEAAGKVVDAGVNAAGVARRRVHADGVLGLDDHHLMARQGHLAGAGETDDPRADDHAIGCFRHSPAPPRRSTGRSVGARDRAGQYGPVIR